MIVLLSSTTTSHNGPVGVASASNTPFSRRFVTRIRIAETGIVCNTTHESNRVLLRDFAVRSRVEIHFSCGHTNKRVTAGRTNALSSPPLRFGLDWVPEKFFPYPENPCST